MSLLLSQSNNSTVSDSTRRRSKRCTYRAYTLSNCTTGDLRNCEYWFEFICFIQ